MATRIDPDRVDPEHIVQTYWIDPEAETVRWATMSMAALPELLGTRHIEFKGIERPRGLLAINADLPDDLARERFFTLAGDPRAYYGKAMYMGPDPVKLPKIAIEDFSKRVQFLTAHDILRLVTRL